MSGLLNRQFLQSIGLSLDDETYDALSMHYEETLSERVIAEIVDELDESQLKELYYLKDRDVAMLRSWLVENVPQLDVIIEDEVAILLGEIAESSDEIGTT